MGSIRRQGYVASGDGYSRRMDEITSDISDKTMCVDDTLLWANDLESSFFQAVHFLDCAAEMGSHSTLGNSNLD